jgi:dipeptidyl aminopeptidase/acylaminoacyl peptidase
MRRLALFFVILSAALSFAQTKHPFTFEDMMALKRVGDPQPSPDGKWVLFSVVDVSLEANTKTPHVWIVPTARGEAREIIFTQQSDRPRWAPDGKHFAFVSTKEKGSQIWIADFDSSKGTVTAVHQFTSIATEAGGELWSPDGKNILFTSDVYPECDGEASAEAICNQKKLKEVEQSKVKAMIFTSLLYRHWNAYKGGKRSHIFVLPVAWFFDHPSNKTGVYNGPLMPLPRDLTPGDHDAPIFSLGGQDNYTFSPDGQEICYALNFDSQEATSTKSDLWLVSVNGGAPKLISGRDVGGDSSPLYSPDGKYIAYRSQRKAGYESDRFQLIVYDRSSGLSRRLTDHFGPNEVYDKLFDRWVGSYLWSPDSKRIYLVAENEGASPIYEVGDIDQVFSGTDVSTPHMILNGFNDDLALTSDGKTLVFTRMSIAAPTQINSLPVPLNPPCNNSEVGGPQPGDCEFPKATQLTHLNDSVLSQVAMSPIESFWFEGAKGDKVQGFMVKPPNFDANKKYPVKFLIHGGPQGAWGDDWSYRWNPELFAVPTSATPSGYAVIMINFHGSTGYGQKFIDAINGDWGGAPFEDLMKGLDYAEKTYPFIDKDRECAMGASYGGYMTNWILGHTDRFKCIVTHDGMFNSISAWGTTEELWFNEWEFKGTPYTNREMYEKWSPNNAAKYFKTPTLVVHSQLDYRLDVSEGFQLFTTLQRQGIPSKMLYFPDEGHWVLKPQNSQLWYKTVNDWVDQWTKTGR